MEWGEEKDAGKAEKLGEDLGALRAEMKDEELGQWGRSLAQLWAYSRVGLTAEGSVLVMDEASANELAQMKEPKLGLYCDTRNCEWEENF